MIKIYGIKNCDTVKKALNWLLEREISFQFHDYKKDGVDAKKLQEFLEKLGHEKLINRKGITWKKLSAEEQSKIIDNKSALKLMIEKPSVIKRPIIDLGSKQILGFDADEYFNELSR
jgi:arsenate reductase